MFFVTDIERIGTDQDHFILVIFERHFSRKKPDQSSFTCEMGKLDSYDFIALQISLYLSLRTLYSAQLNGYFHISRYIILKAFSMGRIWWDFQSNFVT